MKTPKSPLQARDISKGPWRELAAYAISQGWVITRTNGGHLRWTSPDGQPVFSPATSSDWRAARNHRRDLERYGLQKEGQ